MTSTPDLPDEARTFRWIALAAGFIALGVFGCAVLVAVELPFGEWDAMAYGRWAQLIAQHWPHIRFAVEGAQEYHRPFFYFLEGTVWKIFGFHQSLGELLSLAFGVLLAASLAYVAARTSPRRYAAVGAAVVVGLLLATTPFERYVDSGLTDVPVAAMLALTAALLFARRLGRAQLPLVGLAACLSLLTKPTALASLLGLAAAVLLGSRAGLRRRANAAVAIGAGTALALVYDAIQAHLTHVGLVTFLTSGSDGFYTSLAASHRSHELLDESWLGADLRVLLLFGVAYGVARLRLAHRASVGLALALAVVWSIAGPHLAHAGGGVIPEAGGTVERVAIVVAVASILFGLDASAESIPGRLELARLLVWLAPPTIVWVLYSVYDVRLLSAAWPPMLLLIGRALLPAVEGIGKWDARAALVPAAAVLVLGAWGAVQLDGLGSGGWPRFTSALGNTAALDGVGLGGDFDAELSALQPQLAGSSQVITSDARLTFWYPNKVVLASPTSCAQIRAPRTTLVLLEDDEDRTVYGDKTMPPYWLACRHPTPTLVSERPGAFAILTTAKPAAAAAASSGCPSATVPGLAVEFGRFSSPAAAQALQKQVKGVGFVEATVQQAGCGSYLVVETGVPSRSVGESILAEARSAHLHPRLIGSATG